MERLPQGYFSFDIETTGQWLMKDQCFAIGLAYGSSLTDVRTFNFCFNLKKPADFTWGEHWRSRGFEERCYNSFWSKQKDVLQVLQNPKKVDLYDTEREMIDRLNETLTVMESKFEKVSLVTDKVAYDTMWFSYLLHKYGHHGLMHTRNGEYRQGGSFELDSYMFGVYNIHPSHQSCPWDDDDAWNSVIKCPHDHHPEHDALHIYQRWFATLNVVQEKSKK